MFKDLKAFSSFSVNDLAKAKEFYGQTLGLEVEDGEMGTLTVHLATDGKVMVYPKSDHTPASFTVLNFLVPNVEQAVNELTQKGVQFEHYDTDMFKTDEKGIVHGEPGKGPTIAWFKDPAGNIIAVIEEK